LFQFSVIGANEDSVVGHEVEIIIVFGPAGFVPAVKRTIYFSLSLSSLVVMTVKQNIIKKPTREEIYFSYLNNTKFFVPD
jgi:hypothetical protein